VHIINRFIPFPFHHSISYSSQAIKDTGMEWTWGESWDTVGVHNYKERQCMYQWLLIVL